MTHTTTRLALPSDAETIVALSAQVQQHLTASGSLQDIGPLKLETVLTAAHEKRVYVHEDAQTRETIGCAFVRPIDEHYFPPSSGADFDITTLARPWQYVHTVMLRPEVQGRGLGRQFFTDVVELLRPCGGTILLDCWAGNDKLREFYAKCGCRFVATLREEDYYIAVFVYELAEGKG
ncbi:acyl-CoA N-acyltransferase [Neohortaea acidophila]|uniref:Acyl-CoA N-acyltransferase n=1 Tax=Neohortaea acidophila TaxID=245834 RepID=A0A6A6Q2R8_9PEZI|nr:acyl-CoA N-acyltransferase [Neohortaea acidophila]KAF2486246.1 acyl-CoA N-acyltransferase [Neohortaea acidophila]